MNILRNNLNMRMCMYVKERHRWGWEIIFLNSDRLRFVKPGKMAALVGLRACLSGKYCLIHLNYVTLLAFLTVN